MSEMLTLAETAAMTADTLHKSPDPCIVVVFGASGDLAQRKLLPALFSLRCEGLLPEPFAVVGMARSAMDHAAFRERIRAGVGQHARYPVDGGAGWAAFADSLFYLQGSYDDEADFGRLAALLAEIEHDKGVPCNLLFYLATPPGLFAGIVARLGAAGLARPTGQSWRRIIIEKPFGHDLASAVALNQQIHEVFEESQVYRIDHYLGKETVQNLLVFRFANAIFEPLWNRNYIDHVQITVAEEVGLGDRAGYYDKAGVLRDMFQNHLLQLLTLTAMEPPAELNATALRDEKVKVLKAVRRIRPEVVRQHTVRAQYRIYRDEKGVAPGTETATYAAIKLSIDNWRWRDVPFYLRTGKALTDKMTEIIVQFRRVPHSMFPQSAVTHLPPNVLSLCIQPNEGMSLHFETKVPGAGMKTRSVDMSFLYESDFGENVLPDAYERLLLDGLQGDASLFTRSDEIELAWAITDPIVAGWASRHAPALVFYESGTAGPVKADEFIEADGRAWRSGCGEI